MISAYKEMWKRWSDFSGRSGTGKYWWSWLMNMLILVPLWIVGIIFLVAGAPKTEEPDGTLSGANGGLLAVSYVLFGILFIYSLAIIIPFLALTIRRLHDTNKSGWFYLISLIPFGGLVLLVFLASGGDPGPNQYGPPEGSGPQGYGQGSFQPGYPVPPQGGYPGAPQQGYPTAPQQGYPTAPQQGYPTAPLPGQDQGGQSQTPPPPPPPPH